MRITLSRSWHEHLADALAILATAAVVMLIAKVQGPGDGQFTWTEAIWVVAIIAGVFRFARGFLGGFLGAMHRDFSKAGGRS
jgi:hypothetical protein